MLKMLAFIVCEKVIIEKDTETPNVISVVQTVKFQAQPGAPDPSKDAMAPFRWAVFTVLNPENDDIGKSFRQRGDIILPDGSTAETKLDLPFVVKHGLNFNIITIFGFPIGQLGTLQVRMWIESATGETVVPYQLYPLKVEQVSSIAQPEVAR
jgi:hypothetical protein